MEDEREEEFLRGQIEMFAKRGIELEKKNGQLERDLAAAREEIERLKKENEELKDELFYRSKNEDLDF